MRRILNIYVTNWRTSIFLHTLFYYYKSEIKYNINGACGRDFLLPDSQPRQFMPEAFQDALFVCFKPPFAKLDLKTKITIPINRLTVYPQYGARYNPIGK